MTHDIDTLTHILDWVLCIAAVCATSSPVVYLFTPWWSRPLGRIMMLRGVALALAVDTLTLFQFWHPKNILIYFWVYIVVFTIIALASVLMTYLVVRLNILERNDYDGPDFNR